MTEERLVHVVVVNWNGWRDTVECVDSCLRLDYSPFRVVVVDNGSKDESLRELRSRYGGDRRVEIVEAGLNLGFAGGNNLGIRMGMEEGGRFAWLLNNDATADPGALSALVEAADRSPRAGMFGSKICYYDRPGTIWFAGGELDREGNGCSLHLGLDEPDRGQHDAERTVFYASGCSLLVRREVIEAVGTLSEDYFLYWEEVDWNARAHEAGWETLYVPASKVLHKVGASAGKSRRNQYRYDFRNRLMFYGRHEPARVPALRRRMLRTIASFLRGKGSPGDALAMVSGIVDYHLGRKGPVA